MPFISLDPSAPFFIALNAGSGHDDVTQTRARIEEVLTAAGRLGEADNVTSFAFRRIRVTAASRRRGRPVKVVTDGEIVWLSAPIEFRAAPNPLYLLKPDPAPSPEPAR